MFDRHIGKATSAEDGMYPAVNQNYYNPLFFSSRQAATVEPGEQVLGIINTSDKLYKYYGFVETIVSLTNKQTTIYVKNVHLTKNVEVRKNMVLDDLLKHPFVVSGFCAALETDIGCVEVFHHWENERCRRLQRGMSPAVAHLAPYYKSKTSMGDYEHKEADIEEEGEDLLGNNQSGDGETDCETYDEETGQTGWINRSFVY